MWPFLASLVAIVLFASLLGKDRMLATALILLANWGVNTAMVAITGDDAPWMAFLAVDYLSAFLLLVMHERPAVWQVLVAALFALECVAHGAFGYCIRTGWTIYYYYWTLAYTAWAQVALVGVWGCVDIARRNGLLGRSGPHHVAGRHSARQGRSEP